MNDTAPYSNISRTDATSHIRVIVFFSQLARPPLLHITILNPNITAYINITPSPQFQEKMLPNLLSSLLLIFTIVATVLSQVAPGTPQFRKEFLRAHNKYRREHGVANLKWDPNLERSAQAYANKCIWGHSKGVSDGSIFIFFVSSCYSCYLCCACPW